MPDAKMFKAQVPPIISNYRNDNDSKKFPEPQVVFLANFRDEVLELYRNSEYPSEYVDLIDSEIKWDDTSALTIFGNTMSQPAIIAINLNKCFSSIEHILYHELVHVDDFYSYCSKIKYLDKSFLDLRKFKDFENLRLLSEFRAFYLVEMRKDNDVDFLFRFFALNPVMDNLYKVMAASAHQCAWSSKFSTDEKLNSESYGFFDELVKFLYPLRNKPILELALHFEQFDAILERLKLAIA